ncbi:N-acetylmuramoyl-L-alanine amidase [Pelotomaculum propionicicum]|uniref:S-layer protein sap n=1 Tax=Pelotomaculum propionicicum TaxID=258475 RepID=A0A4Y7RCC1_9FIRM|nr:N-acetylmuramoyl-L-alanine amidase [Pelotomaculum propionicicum]TEB06363.1 S-layer protein sap [Pelotomaculum propionicicum]
MEIIEVQYNWANGFIPRATTDAIVLHHAESPRCTAQDVHRWHLDNGWAGIGYHYFVAKDGTVYRGRPRDVVGAHVENHNWHTIGICAEGNYHPSDRIPVDTQMPVVQKNSIVGLCHELLTVYSGAQILGHRDLLATACPGEYFPLVEIQQAVRNGQNIQEVLSMFPDTNGHWAAQDIEWLRQKGIIKGDEQGNFRPDQPITRAEVVSLLARTLRTLGVQ